MRKKIKNFIAGRQVEDTGCQLVVSKQNGDSQIVVALVLIAVAVGLCIVFRAQIYNIMNNLFAIIGNTISNLSSGL